MERSALRYSMKDMPAEQPSGLVFAMHGNRKIEGCIDFAEAPFHWRNFHSMLWSAPEAEEGDFSFCSFERDLRITCGRIRGNVDRIKDAKNN